MLDRIRNHHKYYLALCVLGSAFILVALLLLVNQTALADGTSLHPPFPLLNNDGENVLDAGGPISTMQTCNNCHDTAFIEEHSFHTDVGLNELTEAGQTGSGRAWDTSPGLFGNWNPIIYRYLSPQDDERLDLTTPECRS